MASFKEAHSSLGYFWPKSKPANKWPGRVFIDHFPTARLHCLDNRPGGGFAPIGPQTIHGITDENEYVTMLEALRRNSITARSGESSTEVVGITANYMLVGRRHFDESASVRRLIFSSSMVEHVLRLQATNYRDIRHRRRRGSSYEFAYLQKQVASYVDLAHKLRFRVFRSRVPNIGDVPLSHLVIDFLSLATPKRALTVIHEFRNLLTLICGDLVDLCDVHLVHKHDSYYSVSDLYFPDQVKTPARGYNFPTLPIADICGNRALFQMVLGNWLAETEARRIGRGALASILLDRGNTRLDHLRELVTIIEMQVDGEGTTPLSREQSRELRSALKSTLDVFAEKEADSVSWLRIIQGRIDNINYYNTAKKLEKFISGLPPDFVRLPDGFANRVTELRNSLVHDMSRLKSNDYNRMAFFVEKLKALYALADVIALGAKVEEILKGSQLLRAADYVTPNVFGDDINDDVGENSEGL